LGVTIDENLNFKNHILATAGRVRKLIYTFKLMREATDGPLLRVLYLALCQSVLGYCILAWGGSAKSAMIVLERAQRAVIKVSLRRPRRYPTSELFKEAQVLSVRKIFLLRATLYVHKNIWRLPEHRAMSLRRIYRLPKPRVHTALARRFSVFLFPHIYNKMAKLCDIRNCKFNEVKRKISTLLLSWSYEESEDILKC
jgi:hypothetical protein